MQAVSLKKTLMRAQAQVLNTTPSFLTCDKCGIVHGPRECTIDGKLVVAKDEINFIKGVNNYYNQYPDNFNQGQGFRQSRGMFRS